MGETKLLIASVAAQLGLLTLAFSALLYLLSFPATQCPKV